MRRRYLHILTVGLLTVLLAVSCMTSNAVQSTSEETNNVAVTENAEDRTERFNLMPTVIDLTPVTPEEAGVEAISDEEIKQNTVKTVNRQISTPRASDASEQVWSSILLMQEDKSEEQKKVFDEVAVAVADRKQYEQENAPVVDETPAETPVEETVLEEQKEAVEVVEEKTPKVEVLDGITVDDTPGFVKMYGEDDGVTITAEETSAGSDSTVIDRIIYGDSDTNSDAPSWLYSNKEKNVVTPFDTSGTINVSVYEEKQEEEEDDGIRPEDILAYSTQYKADRETQKKVTEMDKGELYTTIMAFFEKNYQYVFLAFAVVIVALLLKVLVKHLHSEKKKPKSKIKGPEFEGSDDGAVAFNPAAASASLQDVLLKKEKEDYDDEDSGKDEGYEKNPAADPAVMTKRMEGPHGSSYKWNDDGSLNVQVSEDEEISLKDSIDIIGRGLETGFGEQDDEDEENEEYDEDEEDEE